MTIGTIASTLAHKEIIVCALLIPFCKSRSCLFLVMSESVKQKAKKKSAKRKREQSCSICIGRGRIQESESHSDQYCAYPGGPYEGKYKVAKKQRQIEQQKITEVVNKHRESLTSAQIFDALAKVRATVSSSGYPPDLS